MGEPRALRFWNTTLGKKAVMAVSGVVLAGFVIGHLLGNLQIFLGPDRFNGYSRSLRQLPALVWSVRVLLLVMVILHIWSSLELAVTKSEARVWSSSDSNIKALVFGVRWGSPSL